MIAQIDSAPTPKWQVLRDRRVQSWGGVVGKFGLIPDGMLPKVRQRRLYHIGED